MLEKIERILKEYTDINIKITSETLLMSDLGLSSFDLIQLVCKVEDEFDVEIPDKIIKDFKTIGDVMDFIVKQK